MVERVDEVRKEWRVKWCTPFAEDIRGSQLVGTGMRTIHSSDRLSCAVCYNALAPSVHRVNTPILYPESRLQSLEMYATIETRWDVMQVLLHAAMPICKVFL